ncbi:MAG: bifunctional folylpolyglutamate synthase/dihydrofolate synthase, partial [Clostridia bacterium]|nr:bifunctional folylpolyglutamate synthase/dihydrofolate synthase [Clostridia bacterium]
MAQRMTYAEALDFIHGAYVLGEKNGLSNMRRLLARLSNPETGIRALHVAGTNGKGSVCALLQAALRCAGYKTGLYTSPFLERFNERIRIDGKPIPDESLVDLVERIAPEIETLRAGGYQPTEFEIGSALAFLYFAQEKVDVSVIEVGLGGRLDPTNTITPLVCGIASIGLDHQHILGATLPQIAAEKAGIAKP